MAEFMRRLFINKYLRDPHLIFSLMEQLRNKDTSDLVQTEQVLPEPDSQYFEDLKVLCEAPFPTLRRSESHTADVVAKFLNYVKNGSSASQGCK